MERRGGGAGRARGARLNVTLICNLQAGKRVTAGTLDPAIEILERAGWSVSTKLSQAPGDAGRLAGEAVAGGADAVLVAGGDGTLNEVIQSLAGSEVALGYLPYGTVNVWARETQIPLDARSAARAMVHGRRTRIDLGMAGSRYFLLMAGLGFDSEVLRRAQRVEQHKYRFGVLPYVAVGLATAGLYRGVDLELRYDGLIRRVQALLLIVSNTRLYGGRFRLTPEAVANDGWLDVCIIKGKGPVSLMRQSIPILVSGSARFSDVEMLRLRRLSVQAAETLPLQLDGELVGSTPVLFQIAPKALEVIVPKSFASDLIA